MEISELRNLGNKSQAWLKEIGVFTREDLIRIGSVEIYRLLRQQGLPASLNLVYAIEATLADIDWRELSPQTKAELKESIKNL